MKPTLVFKGTTPTSIPDWANNLKQGLNLESDYYRKAVEIGKALKASGESIDLAGHSLGGGMVSAASRASGLDCHTFNAAGLHPKTVGRCGGTFHTPKVENIQAYQVKGEILAGVQEQSLSGTLGAAAAGFLKAGPKG